MSVKKPFTGNSEERYRQWLKREKLYGAIVGLMLPPKSRRQTNFLDGQQELFDTKSNGGHYDKGD